MLFFVDFFKTTAVKSFSDQQEVVVPPPKNAVLMIHKITISHVS